MKKSTLFLLLLCSIPLQSASPVASASWLQQVRQNVTPSGETISEKTKQKIAPIMKSITKKISWKKVAALIAVSALGLVAYRLIFDDSFRSDLIDASVLQWQLWHLPKKQRIPIEKTFDNLLPKDVARIVGSYLYPEEEYELYTTITRPLSLFMPFVLNNDGTRGVDWLNDGEEASNFLRIWDIVQKSIIYSFTDANPNRDMRNQFLTAYFKDNQIRVVSTKRANNAVTIQDVDIDQKSDQFNNESSHIIATFRPLGQEFRDAIRYATISGNGKKIAVVNLNGRIGIGEIPSQPDVNVSPVRDYIQVLDTHDSNPIIALNYEGTQALTVPSYKGVLSLWDLKNEPTRKKLKFKTGTIFSPLGSSSFGFSHDETQVAVIGRLSKMTDVLFAHKSQKWIGYIFDTHLNTVVANLGPSLFVVYNHAGNLIATGQYDTVKLWNENGALFQTLPVIKSGGVVSAIFSGDDHTLAIVSEHGVDIWKTKTAIGELQKRAVSE